MTEEHKHKIGLTNSISQKFTKHNISGLQTPESIEKRRLKMLGKKQSPETIEKRIKRGKEHYNYKHGLANTPKYNSFIQSRRRVKWLNNGGSHTIIEWNELKKKFNFMCLCCKEFEPKIKLTQDHIIPISLGGADNIENIQPLCQSCNSIKYQKIINYKDCLIIS